MKKFFYLAFAAIFSCAASLVSCSSDNDEIGGGDNFSKAVANVNYEFSADLLTLFDVTIEVTDFDGKSEKKTITQAGKEKLAYSTTKRNGEFSATLDVKPKGDIAVDGKSYEMTLSCDVTYAIKGQGDGALQMFSDGLSGISSSFTYTIDSQAKADRVKERYTINKNSTRKLVNGRFEN